MALFQFGAKKLAGDHSFMWTLTISNDSEQQSATTARFRHEKHDWYVNLKSGNPPFTEYVMYCSVKALPDQKGISRLLQLYRLSIVDDSLREMWSKTVKDSFVTYRFIPRRGMFLSVPSSIMSDVKDCLYEGEECFVKLDFINKGERKGEENESETVPSTALYQDIEALSEAVKELLLDDDHCDVTIAVQGREIRAHRIIFSVRSPVFKKMFAHDMLEKESGRVEIEDCDPDVFALFHRFLYTGKADGLTEKNVVPLYHVADKYSVPSLCKICVLFIKNNFDVEEFGDFAEIACMNKEDLFASTVEFMAENFREISETIKWKQFMRKNPEGANELYREVCEELSA